jgi:hypothetical protein
LVVGWKLAKAKLAVQYDRIAGTSGWVETMLGKKYAVAVLSLIRDERRERRTAPLQLALGERGVTGAA